MRAMQSSNSVVGSARPQPSGDAGRALRLCMIGLDDYPHLLGTPRIDSIGGESVQHIALARAFHQLGVEVSLLVFDEGQPKVHDVDGIRTIAICGEKAGMPGLRFIHPRGTSLVRAMRFAQTASRLRRRGAVRFADFTEAIAISRPRTPSRPRDILASVTLRLSTWVCS